jgi:hypothetical protein
VSASGQVVVHHQEEKGRKEGGREGGRTYLISSLTDLRRGNLVLQLRREVSAGGQVVVHAGMDVFAQSEEGGAHEVGVQEVAVKGGGKEERRERVQTDERKSNKSHYERNERGREEAREGKAECTYG